MHQFFTPFQNVCRFVIALSQISPTLTKFVEKYILTSTIPNKCTNKIYFMVNLMKLFWSMQHGYGYAYRYRADTDMGIRHFLKKPDTRIRFSNFL